MSINRGIQVLKYSKNGGQEKPYLVISVMATEIEYILPAGLRVKIWCCLSF